ncbi:uncharacterized protein LY89DRAFT_253019 [Mollisia scopiformis]|uniref:Uncharacterized protein n=1 Tax=Mollisia scopiformis TaxID=149040 RepID=A0A194WSM4_MOLSC|nr:uncharacterized protein LY89DRAFT_253019 [Mollisia scopiformis]KUJ10960.1 hypothetical protein LY89DRAFT_253019 [Mollisia scopiformis]
MSRIYIPTRPSGSFSSCSYGKAKYTNVPLDTGPIDVLIDDLCSVNTHVKDRTPACRTSIIVEAAFKRIEHRDRVHRWDHGNISIKDLFTSELSSLLEQLLQVFQADHRLVENLVFLLSIVKVHENVSHPECCIFVPSTRCHLRNLVLKPLVIIEAFK